MSYQKTEELNNVKALLFDLDGTLINSEKAFFQSFKSILKNNFNILITKEDHKKYTLALVTTCRRYYLDILIKELSLENLFDIIVAREDVKNLKPEPDAYLKAIKYLNLNNENCIVFEDSKRGIDSSINSGLKTVQLTNFTSIKYNDDRCMQFISLNKAVNKILKLRN